MTDTSKPETEWTALLLVPNSLARSEELKPSVKRRWLDLSNDLGPLDYKAYLYDELGELWGVSRKPAQAMLRNLEKAGLAAVEESRDKDVLVYLFPTGDKPEEHLEAIKKHVESSHWRRKQDSIYYGFKGTEPYRNKYLKEHGHFTMVPPSLINDERLTHNDVIVYVVIRGADGKWGKRALAKAANISESTYHGSQKRLETLGYINHDSKPRKVNRYTFNDAPESVSTQTESVSTPMNIKSNTEEEYLTNSETAVAVEHQEISSFNQGLASGDAIGAAAPLASAPALRASVSVSLVTASALCASAPISFGEGNSAVTHSIPAHRGTEKRVVRGGVVYENKAQRDARMKKALQDKIRAQIARENAQKEKNANG